MKSRILTIIILAIALEACCLPRHRDEPAYPKNVFGWKEHQDNGVRSLGDFVLKPGEGTDNEKIQIKLLDVIPGNPCAEAVELQYQARARLQFIRLSDHKVLCEDLFSEHISMTFSITRCDSILDDSGILYVNVLSINLKDRWAFFSVG